MHKCRASAAAGHCLQGCQEVLLITVVPVLQPLAYMCMHISLTMMTFMLCKIWWCVPLPFDTADPCLLSAALLQAVPLHHVAAQFWLCIDSEATLHHCRDYHTAHTLFLIFIFVMSAWNGTQLLRHAQAACCCCFLCSCWSTHLQRISRKTLSH